MENVLLLIVRALFATSFLSVGAWMTGFMGHCLISMFRRSNYTIKYVDKTYKFAYVSLATFGVMAIISHLTGVIDLF